MIVCYLTNVESCTYLCSQLPTEYDAKENEDSLPRKPNLKNKTKMT